MNRTRRILEVLGTLGAHVYRVLFIIRTRNEYGYNSVLERIYNYILGSGRAKNRSKRRMLAERP